MNVARLVMFTCLQFLVVGVSILVGWNSGLPADRERLSNYEFALDEIAERRRMMNNLDIEQLQTIIELLQTKTNVEDAIDLLNMSINAKITESSGGREFCRPGGLEWPSGEDQFNLILRIAKHRKSYPARCRYSPLMSKEHMDRIFDEAEKCKLRRARTPKWIPPPTTRVEKVEIIEYEPRIVE